MSYLQKILAAKQVANKTLPEEMEGVKIVERPIMDFGKRDAGGGIGMHRLDEEGELQQDSHAFHSLIDDATRDGFKTIYVYNQGGKPTHSKPHLYLIKADTDQPWAYRKKEALRVLKELEDYVSGGESIENKDIAKNLEKLDDLLVRRVKLG